MTVLAAKDRVSPDITPSPLSISPPLTTEGSELEPTQPIMGVNIPTLYDNLADCIFLSLVLTPRRTTPLEELEANLGSPTILS
jgi:hypothetical protein